MKITTACHTDKGKIRATNEDAVGYFSLSQGDLFIVCDGMGGHAAGEVASQMAVESIHVFFQKNINQKPEKLLREAIIYANNKIWQSAQSIKEYEGMGTTCVVAFLQDNFLQIGHVGDSRAYLFSENKLTSLTKDHSYVQRLLDMHIIEPQDIPTHPQRGVITRSLGYEPHIQPEISKIINVKPEDVLLLCTDGITAELNDEQIQSIMLHAATLDEKAKQLVETAKTVKGSDNITAFVALLSK
jgi:serine/threonine protein phosphatase PrpC